MKLSFEMFKVDSSLKGLFVPLVIIVYSTYNASQKHESTLLHTYVLNEFLTADRSVQQNISEKHLYASFGAFCIQIGQFLKAQ